MPTNGPLLSFEQRQKFGELLAELHDMWGAVRGVGEARGQNEFVREVLGQYGIGTALYSNWKNGNGAISYPYAKKLANAFLSEFNKPRYKKLTDRHARLASQFGTSDKMKNIGVGTWAYYAVFQSLGETPPMPGDTGAQYLLAAYSLGNDEVKRALTEAAKEALGKLNTEEEKGAASPTPVRA